MDRCWLITWTTYGTWLPGDPRGFVGRSRDASGRQGPMEIRPEHPRLRRTARSAMVGRPIWLQRGQADAVVNGLQHTATIRAWDLIAAAVMRNHVHAVVGVDDDPDPATLLRDFKPRASHALNDGFGRPARGRWWTRSGSRRLLPDETAIVAAVRYVLDQYEPLVAWGSSDPGLAWAFVPAADR